MPTIDEIAYIYNALPTASIILKANFPYFTIVTANTVFLSNTNTDLPAIMGKNFFDEFPAHTDEIDNIEIALEHVLRFKKAYQIESYKYNHLTLTQQLPLPIFWKIDIYPLLDLDGEIEYIVQSWEDVTPIKEGAKREKLAKKRNFDLFNFSPIPMLAYDTLTYKIVAANNAAQKNYGYTLQEFLNLQLQVLWPGEDLSNSIFSRKDINLNNPSKITVRHIRKDGTIIYVDIKSQAISSWGENTRIFTALDVTESKLTEDALKSSNELYDYVNRATNDAIYDWDIVNNHLEWGEAFSRVFGYHKTGDSFPIEDWSLMLHLDDLEYTNSSLNQLLKDKEKINWAIEYRLKKANGEYAFVQENGYVLRDTAGNAIRMIGVLQDITQRMEHELKIKEHLERYNAVSKATSDTIWDYNLLTNEIIWNNDGKNVFGHRRTTDTYDWWKDQVHPDDLPQILAVFESCISRQQPRWIGEYRFKCRDGSYKAVLDRGFLIFDDNGKVIRMIGAMQDITERVNYIHTIEQRNLRLSDIAWAQAHLVRAPLARIIGIVQLLHDEKAKADTDEKKLLSYLDISAKELDEIVTGIINKSII